MSEDVVCLECDVYKKRCSELTPILERQILESASLGSEIIYLQKIYDLKCDDFKELLLTNAKLRLSLSRYEDHDL